ncbi:MAG: hypothetical protein O3B01_22180 [Planctomycetota bacterium]|nr:hypothetical protein [Planctomycetota bacterium]MDA1141279.1 hypothetical protein [Planctomycetota bacterium]
MFEVILLETCLIKWCHDRAREIIFDSVEFRIYLQLSAAADTLLPGVIIMHDIAPTGRTRVFLFAFAAGEGVQKFAQRCFLITAVDSYIWLSATPVSAAIL